MHEIENLNPSQYVKYLTKVITIWRQPLQGLNFGFQYTLIRIGWSKKFGVEYWALFGSNSLWRPCLHNTFNMYPKINTVLYSYCSRYNISTESDPKDPLINTILLRNLYFPKPYCVGFTCIRLYLSLQYTLTKYNSQF